MIDRFCPIYWAPRLRGRTKDAALFRQNWIVGKFASILI